MTKKAGKKPFSHIDMIPIIEAAALAKVNVLCFQEAWSKKFKIKP